MADLDRKSTDSDSQLKALQKMLAISQETEADLKRQLENAVGQKQNAQTRLDDLQRKLEALESQKREWMSSKMQMERDLANYKNQIAMVSYSSF